MEQSHPGKQNLYQNVLRFPTVGSTPARGEVEFRNVSLLDAASGRELLNDISFHVRPGTRVGIVGPSDSGMVDLLNLLTGFREPSAGAIFLDGKKLREYDSADIRRQFSIVTCDPMFSASTVAANIADANSRASRADVMRAAKLAHAHEFIVSLPGGYDTLLEQGGAALSAGERQQLAIARAFLKDSPLLVLDGLLDADEVQDRQEIVDALDRLTSGRTSFTIAHRIGTLERCDMVLVLNHGSLDAVCTGDDYAKAPRLARMSPASVPRSIDMLTPGPVLVRMEQ